MLLETTYFLITELRESGEHSEELRRFLGEGGRSSWREGESCQCKGVTHEGEGRMVGGGCPAKCIIGQSLVDICFSVCVPPLL